MKGTEEHSHKGREGREGLKGRTGRKLVCVWRAGAGYRDRIARAFAREVDHARVSTPECDTVMDHVFRCVCCGRLRGEEERREPRSGLCIRCVREAGFWN